MLSALVLVVLSACANGSAPEADDATTLSALTAEGDAATTPIVSAVEQQQDGPAVSIAAPTGDTAASANDAPSDPDPAAVTTDIEQIPGDEPDVTVSALRDGIDHADLPAPAVDPSEIVSGGPPPDGIPPIDAPTFQRVGDVDWLADQEAVIAVTVDGDARAYPVRILIWHEIVNDTIGGQPVTLTYCPLCNSAVAYVRRVGERVLDFGTSGKLFNSSLVMYDRQTESLWLHFTGQAVAGTLTGTQLELIPVATVAYETFARTHPDGLVLAVPTGFERAYGTNPYVDYDTPDGTPFLFSGETDPRLGPQERVLLIRADDATAAIPSSELLAVGVVSVTVGGRQVVAFGLSGTATPLQTREVALGRDVGSTGAFRPVVDGRELSFRRIEGADASSSGAFADAQTGSTWNLFGFAVDGPLAGKRLAPVEHLDTFWFAAAAFDPDVLLVTGVDIAAADE